MRGRITGLVDVFDALTTARPYKDAWTIDKAIEWIRDEQGKQFDPELIDFFLGNMDRVLKILEEYGDEDTHDARDAALN